MMSLSVEGETFCDTLRATAGLFSSAGVVGLGYRGLGRNYCRGVRRAGQVGRAGPARKNVAANPRITAAVQIR